MLRKGMLAICFIMGLMLLMPTQTARANGDPVIEFSSINRVGNPTPRPIKDVQILKERLLIQPRGAYTYVEVEYTLHNHSDKDYKQIDYGFPIDYQGEAEGSSFSDHYIREDLHEIGWQKEWIKDVRFSLDGKPLEWHAAHEVVTPKHKEYVVEYEVEATIESASRLWHYTRFGIRKQDTVSLKVSYQVYQKQYIALNRLHKSPLSRHFTGGAEFYYDFSPAQHWGDGTANQLEITVDCSVIQNTNINWKRIYRQEKEEKFPYPFKLKGDQWVCQMERFDFKEAELLFGFHWGSIWKAPLSVFHPYEVDRSLYRIETSSAQASCPSHHLSDQDTETSWAPQNKGVGETITITFPEPQVLSDIMFYNGNHRSVSDWMETPRVENMLMEVTWADGFRETKEMRFWIYSEHICYYNDREGYGRPCFIALYNLTDKVYGRWKKDESGGNFHPINDNRISQIKLEIREVSPSDSPDAVCVSEIVLLNGWKE